LHSTMSHDAERQARAAAPHKPVQILHAGQTLWSVASSVQSDLPSLVAANPRPLRELAQLAEGSVVKLPTSSSATHERIEQRAVELGLGSAHVAAQLYAGQVEPAWLAPLGPAELAPATLLWPVESGHFVRGFGSGAGEYHEAVDIAAESDSAVRAALPGLVAYAGDAIEGYGNLLLLVHPGALITMYAHNETLEVEAGQLVDVGDLIATVGSTGLSRGPHVHFELMHDGENCDPAPLFHPGIRNQEGVIEEQSPRVTWPPGEERPREVRCLPRRHQPH
jgi:murein DD-endopeptidase MepM/ murein hydrolase activator NlpD